MKRGQVTERAARQLLALYGVPLSAPSKVYTGDAPKKPSESLW